MPPPKPTRNHQLAGTYRRDRHAGPELRPSTPPRAPAWLSADGKRCWRDTARILCALGILDPNLDAPVLALWCETWVLWRAAGKAVTERGPTYERGGLVKANPAVAIAAQAARDLANMAEKLGMTPSARRRLRIELPDLEEEEDPLDQLIAGKPLKRTRPGGILTRDRQAEKPPEPS